MKNIFLISFFLLIISINTQQNQADPQTQKKPETNNTLNNTQKLGDSLNQKNPEKKVNGTDEKKPFNLTEALTEFFTSMFSSFENKTEEQKKEEQKKEEQKKKDQKILEQINTEKETKEKKKKEEERLKKEKEQAEFFKKIENVTINDLTNLNLEAKGGELLYHNTTMQCKLKIIILLTDTEKTIHMNFNGPNGRGGTSLIQSFRNKNYLYYEYNAKYVGQYTFYLNNYHNSDETEVIFAMYDDSKKGGDKLEKKKIDKISGYLNDIDGKVNTMSVKQNVVNRKTDIHNESVNRHNKKILIYSVIEVITMIIVFVLQTCYIKRIVEKI